MNSIVRILHLEDSESDAELIQVALRKGGLAFEVERVENAARFEELMLSGRFEIALCDYNVPGFNGFAAIQKMRAVHPDLPIILLSGALGEEQAVECLKSGATDYILKGRLHRLVPAIRRALAEAESERERRTADAQLRINEERLRCVLMATNDVVYDCDLQSGEIWWNQCLRSLFGHNPHEFAADMAWWKATVHPEDRQRIVRSLERALKGQASGWSGEYRFLCSDGKWAHVYDRGYILRNEDGAGVRLVGAMMDITERKQLEEEFLRSQRMESIGTIAGGVAHDLNNMLSPILVASELLRASLSTPEDLAMLDIVKDSVSRGADLVKQIMTFARGISGERVAVDLKLFGKELARLIRSTFPKAIKVEMHFPARLQAALGNPTHMHQVLLNLCVNARDAMREGGTLTITASECTLDRNPETGSELSAPGLFIAFSVKDSGVGIPPENLGRIFEPFFTTKKPGEGTGLGLATVRNIMRGHGGFITVQSAMGQGSEFQVFFPAAEHDLAADAAQGIAAPRGKQQLILLVEDEISIAELSRISLEAHNYRVRIARDPHEAMHLAEREGKALRLVISDYELPLMNGFDLMRTLKRRSPGLKTICTTGSGEPTPAEALEVNCILRKPYGTQDLLKAVAVTLA